MATLCLICLVRKDAVDSDDGKIKLLDLALGHDMGDMWFITVTLSERNNTEQTSCSRLIKDTFPKKKKTARKY